MLGHHFHDGKLTIRVLRAIDHYYLTSEGLLNAEICYKYICIRLCDNFSVPDGIMNSSCGSNDWDSFVGRYGRIWDSFVVVQNFGFYHVTSTNGWPCFSIFSIKYVIDICHMSHDDLLEFFMLYDVTKLALGDGKIFRFHLRSVFAHLVIFNFWYYSVRWKVHLDYYHSVSSYFGKLSTIVLLSLDNKLLGPLLWVDVSG